MIWENDFFLTALLVSFLLTIVSAPLGAFLTLKRMSLMGDAISHSLLPGMAISIMIFGFSTVGLLFGGLIAGVIVLSLMFWITQRSIFKDDSVLALIYLTMSSLGILLISKSDVKIDLMHFLFGNILLVPQEWIYLIAASMFIVLAVFFKIKDRLTYVIVDPEYSQFLKISEPRIKSIFYFLVLWVLILSFYSVGTMLALGYLIIPTLIAKILTKNLNKQILISIFIGWIVSLVGAYLSFKLDMPTGPSIIFVGGLYFLLLMPLRKILLLIFGVLLLFPKPSQAKDNSLLILTSIPLLQKVSLELASGVDDKSVNIESLIQQEQSMHSYSLKPSDLQKLQQTRIFLTIGLGFENFDLKLLKSKFPNLKVISLSDKIPFLKKGDPHIWNHPVNMIAMAKKISAELTILLPEKKSILHNNFLKFESDFSKLHEKYQKEFRALVKKKIVVSHNSFGYLELAYGIEIFSPSGFSSHDHSKPGDITRIKELLTTHREIPLFKEKSANNIFIDQLSKSLKREVSGTLDGEDFLYQNDKSVSLLSYFEGNLKLILESLK